MRFFKNDLLLADRTKFFDDVVVFITNWSQFFNFCPEGVHLLLEQFEFVLVLQQKTFVLVNFSHKLALLCVAFYQKLIQLFDLVPPLLDLLFALSPLVLQMGIELEHSILKSSFQLINSMLLFLQHIVFFAQLQISMLQSIIRIFKFPLQLLLFGVGLSDSDLILIFKHK